MEKLRVLDLFSGIGGFSLGLERTGGFETVAFCEIEEFLVEYWRNTGQRFLAIMTLENSQQISLLPMELPSMSSVADFHAKTLVTPVMERVSKVSAPAYGARSLDLLANYDRHTSSWRTSQRCLVEGWTVFSETWPRSGMMRNGIAFRLQPLAPVTSGTEFGLWPTPAASDTAERKPPARPHITKNGTLRHLNPKGVQSQVRLSQAVKFWPTPSSRDFKGQNSLTSIERSLKSGKNGHLGQLPNAVLYRSGEAGALNPEWVEWLMGFPIGHTDLKD